MKGWVHTVLRYLVASLSVAVVLYIFFALIFSTADERALQKENSLYDALYEDLVQRTALIDDVLDGLTEKDDGIYTEIFSAPAPSLDEESASAFFPAEGDVMQIASRVDANFADIFSILEKDRKAAPPLSLPLKGLSYAQTGASTGLRRKPVLKLPIEHRGLDLVAPQGAPVYAAADGVVTSVNLSRRGLGNTVTIDHRNGYVTRYCLLGEIYTARGRNVKCGQRIGTVGVIPSVPVPHLHYEVRRDTLILDPVHHLFMSVTPQEYSSMVSASVKTAQSMD